MKALATKVAIEQVSHRLGAGATLVPSAGVIHIEGNCYTPWAGVVGDKSIFRQLESKQAAKWL